MSSNEDINLQMRRNILTLINKSGASHVASALSCVEILTSIYSILQLDKIRNLTEDRDRVVLSKGHSVAALYSVLNLYKLLSDEEMLTYSQNGSFLAGHSSHNVKYVEHSTGALGHGLSVAVGMAYGLKLKGYIKSKVYVIVGDGELQEGSNWEALMLAGNLKLNNLNILIDNNKLSGIGKTAKHCNLENLYDKLIAFNTYATVVDGHNIKEITQAIINNNNDDKPNSIICNTIKGKGISFMESNNVWHYRPVDDTSYNKAIIELA